MFSESTTFQEYLEKRTFHVVHGGGKGIVTVSCWKNMTTFVKAHDRGKTFYGENLKSFFLNFTHFIVKLYFAAKITQSNNYEHKVLY